MKTELKRVTHLWATSIAVAFAGLAGLFLLVDLAIHRIDALNRTVIENTAPSIVALESATVHLSRLRALLREHIRAPGDGGAGRERIAAERNAVADHVARYFSLPIDPGEAEVQDDLRLRLARFDDLAGRILRITPETPPRARDDLRTELDVTADGIDQGLVQASEINAAVEVAAVDRLRGARRILLPGAVVLEAASALAAAVAVAAAYRLSRRAAETERRVLEHKNTELEAFSARVAHDLLSPLMAVQMAVSLAEKRLRTSADERLRTTMARAERSIQHLRQMVSDLLDFARAAAAPAAGAATDVTPLLQALVADLQPRAVEAGVELRLVSTSPRRVPCAAGILSSMMSNLVENAIRHSGTAQGRRVEVRAFDAGSEVRFEVEDAGAGVRPEDREAIFEPYVRRDEAVPGLGLGLATVKRLAEAHGGRVGVTSAVGRGALFWVTLPARVAT